jgi:hypothetical protein
VVVLTAQHLEEVERVADVVAIMVRESVHCIGDAAYLKDKFSCVVKVELVLSFACHCAAAEYFVGVRHMGAVRVGGDGLRWRAVRCSAPAPGDAARGGLPYVCGIH